MDNLEHAARGIVAEIRALEGNVVNRRGETMPYGISDLSVCHDYFDANVGWESVDTESLSQDDFNALMWRVDAILSAQSEDRR